MSKDFAKNVMAKSVTATPDPSAEAWAARAFSIISVICARSEDFGLNERALDFFEDLVAKTPDDTMLAGTMMMMGAMGSVIDENGDSK